MVLGHANKLPFSDGYFDYVFSYDLQKNIEFSQMTRSVMDEYKKSLEGAKKLMSHMVRGKVKEYPEIIEEMIKTYTMPRLISNMSIKANILRCEQQEYFPYLILHFESFSSRAQEFLISSIKSLKLDKKYVIFSEFLKKRDSQRVSELIK